MLDIDGQQTAQSFYTVTLAGRLDSRTAREFEHFQDELLRTGRHFLVLDARQLQYVSSSGIAALLGLVRRLSDRGAAVLLQPNREVRMLLGFFGISEYLPIVESEQQARQTLAARSAELADQLSMRAGEPEQLVAPHRELPAAPAGAGRPLTGTAVSQPPRAIPAMPAAVTRPPRPPVPVAVARPMDAFSREDLRETIRADVAQVLREVLPQSLAEQARATAQASAAPAGGVRPAATDSATGGEGRTGASTHAEAGSVESRPAPISLPRPLIVSCEQCGGRFRISRSGRHRCPHCRIEVHCAPDGALRFVEKLGRTPA